MENERLPARPFRLLLHVPVPWLFVLTYFLARRSNARGQRAPRWTSRPD